MEKDDWRSRVIDGGTLGARELPAWAERSYEILHEQVIDDAYPCFFGVQAERHGEMFYAFVANGGEHALIDTMARFAELAVQPVYQKNNIAVFFEPDPVPLSHREYHDRFWRTLQVLHDADTHPHVAEQIDPADPAWEFCYQGVEMFVVCACPSFRKRHSRNLGPGMVLLFQPRSVFVDKITNKVIGRRAREQVRKRLDAWDELGAHPDLGFYGDPGNLEWKQYFLLDDNQPNTGACPFSSRRGQVATRAPAFPRDDEVDSPAPTASGASREGNFPLTSTQEGLWFSWCMAPDSAAYHVSQAVELTGPLDVVVLRRALDLVVDRHEILRTAFMDIASVAQQCVDNDASRAIDWVEHDLRHSVQSMAQAHQVLADRGTQSFDLGGDGLLRVTLLRLTADRHVLQLCAHQIMLDAWSLDRLRRELFEYYSALHDAREPDRRLLPMQFGDYVIRDRDRLDTPTLEKQLSYWRRRLPDASQVLELPLDSPRPACRSTEAGRLSHVMTAEAYAGVQHLASICETTPFVVMLSAFALLLQRYSGQSDVRMAVPLLRRDPTIDDALIGNFTNLAVIRVQVSSTGTFTALVAQGKRYLAEAHANGDLPFLRLVEGLRAHRSLASRLRAHRSLASTPLCQVMFGQVPTFEPEVCGGLMVRAFNDGVGRASYDLSMNVAVERESCTLLLDYSRALFGAHTVQRLLAHYLDLLEQLMQPAAASEAVASLHFTGASAVAAA